jgi:ATP-dependent DNA helicase RecG
MTRRQLQEALYLKSEENFRQLYLMPALLSGFIEMTIPDKPKSRLQKYRLTPKGVAFLQ